LGFSTSDFFCALALAREPPPFLDLPLNFVTGGIGFYDLGCKR
jgi:hypothetical protein